jgi:prepilin-type N-terminal cleavage/methylation domain-containing protein
MPHPRNHSGRRGFTLIELLTVIAVIAILAGILIPTVSAVRTSANKARTKVQFAQWAAAIESFRGAYGHYPVFHDSALVNPPGQSAEPAAPHVFHDLLAGRRRNLDPLPAFGAAAPLAPEAQNRKRIAFCSFSEADFTDTSSPSPHLIRDAFGNTEIAVLVDRNLDGVIRIGADGDYPALPAVQGLTPTAADFPATGVRAGVVFYAPAPGAGPDRPDFILSWK